jgi:hypothetical protein
MKSAGLIAIMVEYSAEVLAAAFAVMIAAIPTLLEDGERFYGTMYLEVSPGRLRLRNKIHLYLPRHCSPTKLLHLHHRLHSIHHLAGTSSIVRNSGIELVALALQSSRPDNLGHVGVGIDSIKTFSESVGIRVNTENELELVFAHDCDIEARGLREVQQNKEYRSSQGSLI